MAPIEIRFLGPGWETQHGPVKDREIVNSGGDLTKVFTRKKKHFTVECGINPENVWGKKEILDNGGKIHFWDEGTEFNAPEGNSLRLDKDIGNIERAHAYAEIAKGGSVKLAVDGEIVAEIRHIST